VIGLVPKKRGVNMRFTVEETEHSKQADLIRGLYNSSSRRELLSQVSGANSD
jgi:hypothetical protein